MPYSDKKRIMAKKADRKVGFFVSGAALPDNFIFFLIFSQNGSIIIS